MFQKLAVLLVYMVLSALSGQALAQDGLYMGMDLGVAIAPGMSVSGTDNDWSTKCDKIINPTQAETGDGCFFPPPPSAWVDQVGEGSGVLTGLARGYRRGNLRVEGEYFLRTTTYDDRSRTRIGVIVFYPLSSSHARARLVGSPAEYKSHFLQGMG